MKVTKIGHCCFVIEEGGVKLLTDPGMFTTGQNEVTGIDAVLITHEHPDHYHLESLKKVLQNNPQAIVITNSGVGALLEKEGIGYTHVSDGEKKDVAHISIEGFGKKHAIIYEQFSLVENTGYLINKRLYFPGDAFYNPKCAIDILALPVAGPWVKIADAIDFVKEIKPRVAFSVHDGILVPSFRGYAEMAVKRSVPEIEYITFTDGDSKEF